MSIDQNYINEYMNFIFKSLPNDNSSPYKVRYKLSNIEVEIFLATTIGSKIFQTNIIVYHNDYIIRYKKIFKISTDLTQVNDDDIVTISVEGNEDILLQHLVLLKLS